MCDENELKDEWTHQSHCLCFVYGGKAGESELVMLLTARAAGSFGWLSLSSVFILCSPLSSPSVSFPAEFISQMSPKGLAWHPAWLNRKCKLCEHVPEQIKHELTDSSCSQATKGYTGRYSWQIVLNVLMCFKHNKMFNTLLNRGT